MKDGIYKIATGTPEVRLGNPLGNVKVIIDMVKEAEKGGAKVLVLPELTLTGAGGGDLYFLDGMTSGATVALDRVVSATENVDMLVVLGAPVAHLGYVYDCAVVICRGKILGIVPKTTATERAFTPFTGETVFWDDLNCYFGIDLLFESGDLGVCVDVGSDVFLPQPPSARVLGAGANVLVNPTATVSLAGKANFVRKVFEVRSAISACAIASADVGEGDTTSDVTFSAHNVIAQLGDVLAENVGRGYGLTYADIDLGRIARQKRQYPLQGKVTTVPFKLNITPTALTKKPNQNPFVPVADKSARAEEILGIQTAGLKGRIKNCNIRNVVIGVSGGLDSTLALLVAVRAIDALSRPRSTIIAVTMPCFGTTSRTKNNAVTLCERLGVTLRTVEIGATVKEHLASIGHDGASDVTFENAQARTRTEVLFDIANTCGGLVLGTGDLSELALGWCTYNGDHMSSYAVNATVPKTLVRMLVEYEAERLSNIGDVLTDILATPVSPELLPTNGEVVQATEDILGPYELHDFFIYHLIGYGESRNKILRYALSAFEGKYEASEIERCLDVFLKRFFTSAFKRSCAPDGVKTGVVSLCPRGDFSMPSDCSGECYKK